MLRTGHLIHPASNPASQPSTGASLPGTLASPRAGLSPAGCPELLARLHHDNLLVVMAPELLGALRDRHLGATPRSGVPQCGSTTLRNAGSEGGRARPELPAMCARVSVEEPPGKRR